MSNITVPKVSTDANDDRLEEAILKGSEKEIRRAVETLVHKDRPNTAISALFHRLIDPKCDTNTAQELVVLLGTTCSPHADWLLQRIVCGTVRDHNLCGPIYSREIRETARLFIDSERPTLPALPKPSRAQPILEGIRNRQTEHTEQVIVRGTVFIPPKPNQGKQPRGWQNRAVVH